VRTRADAENADKLVLRTIERTLAPIGLVPDREVQHVTIKLSANVDQIADVAPIDADVVDRASGRDPNAVAKRLA
jgi:hypothetical protein